MDFATRLEGAHVLVTGGSTETGPFVCDAFAEAGAHLALTYFSHEEEAAHVADRARDRKVRAETYFLDLLTQESIDTLIASLQKDWPKLDVVVLCAGSVGLRNFRGLSREEVDVAIDGNIKGNFMLAKELGYWMKDTGGPGRIIQYSAMSAYNASHSAYGMAKAGQNEMTGFLAYHLAPEVTVNTLIPIRIDQDPEHETAMEADAPLGRAVHSRELARMSLLLCDPAFDTVTGELIRMDSGRHVATPYPRDL